MTFTLCIFRCMSPQFLTDTIYNNFGHNKYIHTINVVCKHIIICHITPFCNLIGWCYTLSKFFTSDFWTLHQHCLRWPKIHWVSSGQTTECYLAYHVSTFYTLWYERDSLDKILSIKVTTGRFNVKSKSQHDTAYIPQSMSLWSINFLHLPDSELYPGQD